MTAISITPTHGAPDQWAYQGITFDSNTGAFVYTEPSPSQVTYALSSLLSDARVLTDMTVKATPNALDRVVYDADTQALTLRADEGLAYLSVTVETLRGPTFTHALGFAGRNPATADPDADETQVSLPVSDVSDAYVSFEGVG